MCAAPLLELFPFAVTVFFLEVLFFFSPLKIMFYIYCSNGELFPCGSSMAFPVMVLIPFELENLCLFVCHSTRNGFPCEIHMAFPPEGGLPRASHSTQSCSSCLALLELWTEICRGNVFSFFFFLLLGVTKFMIG